MRWLSALFVATFASLIAAAGEPVIEGKPQYDPYKIVRLKVTGLDAKDGVLWKVRPADPKAVVDFGLGGKRNLRDLEVTGPPGAYVAELTIVSAGADGALSINEAVFPFLIGPPAPNPPVIPDPVTPIIPPTPSADLVLIAKFRDALKADAQAAFPAGGTKEHAALLADVYLYAAEKLSSKEPSDWPATVGDLFTALGNLSVSKKIPRLPYLTTVRGTAGDTTGSAPNTTPLDSAKRADFAEKFKRAGLALKEAAK